MLEATRPEAGSWSIFIIIIPDGDTTEAFRSVRRCYLVGSDWGVRRMLAYDAQGPGMLNTTQHLTQAHSPENCPTPDVNNTPIDERLPTSKSSFDSFAI